MWPLFRRTSNPGLIWLDERSARRAIASRKLSPDEERNLLAFAHDGFFRITIDFDVENAAKIDADVDRLWHTRPPNIAVAYDSPPRRFSDAHPDRDRKPRYRIHELHAASETALRLYLHPLLHHYASLILGETAVATQSLYFEFGSQQALHRDSTVVPTPEFGKLVAAWIALEDISPDAGPLAYVPGSQRFPFYDFGRNEFTYDPTRDSPDDVSAAMKFYDEQLQRSRLPVQHFLAKRGEVLMWHSALMHGGAPPANEQITRKSLVVHYSTLSTQRSRECAVAEPDGHQSVFTTTEVLERNGAFGFANPLDGMLLYRR